MCNVRFSVFNLFFICVLIKHESSAYSIQYYYSQETWFDAQKYCYSLGGRLATNEDRLNCNQVSDSIDSPQGLTYWTGKYKKVSHWIAKIASSNNMTTDRTKIITDLAVLFTGTHSYKSTKPHDTKERTLIENKVTGKRSFSTIINSSIMVQSTTSIIVKQKDNGNFTDISEHHTTSNIGLIVGGVLGALAIISIIVLVIILKLRKTKAAAKRQNVNQYEIINRTSPFNNDEQRKKPTNNKTVNKLYENIGLHADRPIPVRTKETEIVNEQERKKPNYVNAVIMKNNMISSLQVGFNSVVASEEAIDSEYDILNITPTFLTDNMDNDQYSIPM